MKKTIIAIAALAFIGSAWLVIYLATAPDIPLEPPAAVAPAVEQDPDIKALMDSLKLDSQELNLTKIPSQGSPDALATYNAETKTIHLPNTVPLEGRNVLVSHEYLHYVQDKDQEAANLYPSIARLLATNRVLLTLAVGSCASNCYLMEDEGLSYACTELLDTELPPEVAAWCNKWLPERSELFQ